MKAWICLVGLLFLIGCGSGRQLSHTPEPLAPAWVQSRPVSASYYTGIGIAAKEPGTDYQSVAKKNALNDLASEIKVNVNTNSLLYTLEDRDGFQQDFRESIRTTTDIDLADFEMIDAWQDDNSYWVYYRLNKAQYSEVMKQKKDAARNLALDFYSRARSEEGSGRFATAADYYLRGLQALEKFWNEDNSVQYEGETILLDNALFASLQNLIALLDIKSQGEITLNYQNAYTANVPLSIKLNNGMPASDVPIVYAYYGDYGMLTNKLRTNADGKIKINVVNASRDRSANALHVAVDTREILAPFQNDVFMRRLTQNLKGAEANIPIQSLSPVVYVMCSEKNLGIPMNIHPLQSAILSSLNRHGYRTTSSKAEADMYMEIESDTHKSGSSNGFSSAILSFDLTVKEAKSGDARFQISRSDIRGVDLTYEKAGLKAYQNLTENIESGLMRSLINAL